jgi:hypothetical protein
MLFWEYTLSHSGPPQPFTTTTIATTTVGGKRMGVVILVIERTTPLVLLPPAAYSPRLFAPNCAKYLFRRRFVHPRCALLLIYYYDGDGIVVPSSRVDIVSDKTGEGDHLPDEKNDDNDNVLQR